MSIAALTGVHAKYLLIENFRIPIAVIGTFAFPTLALLCFVAPQRQVAENPEWATQAVISLSVFAVMANQLFSFGLGIAEDREKPWVPYLRTLPAPGIVRMLAHVLSTGLLGLLAIIPVIVVGAIVTSATASIGGVLLGMLALAVAALPFALIGIAIGYGLPSKAAIAVTQIVMFAMAFLGGLFLPPVMFPGWLDTVSRFTPARQGRDLVIWAVQGGEVPWWAMLGIVLWSAAGLALCLVLHRRDEGRRFR